MISNSFNSLSSHGLKALALRLLLIIGLQIGFIKSYTFSLEDEHVNDSKYLLLQQLDICPLL
jgi:hypothetical protein